MVLTFSPILNEDFAEVVVGPTRVYARDKNLPFLVYDRESYPWCSRTPTYSGTEST